jgi:hypothetical protein
MSAEKDAKTQTWSSLPLPARDAVGFGPASDAGVSIHTRRRALDLVRAIRAAEPARDTPIEVELADGVTQWLPVTEEAVVARLDPTARGHVVQADLKALGIADYGVMSGGFALSGGPGLELFHDDVPMTVARYPNKGFIKITEVLGPTPIDVRGTIGCQEARFQTDDQRVARWAAEPAGMVLGYSGT